jgi:sarcosine oxidase gamma subunit
VFSSVVDNSSGLTTIHVTGDNAAALIATDCPLDLHPREFKPGQCAQTRLAKAGMTISPLADGSGFELIIRRSFADYLLLWLQDALRVNAIEKLTPRNHRCVSIYLKPVLSSTMMGIAYVLRRKA